jgi:ankyrin repeat protein
MAQCQLNEIAHKQSERKVRTALASLPKTLYKTYQWILDDMEDSDKEWAKRILLWLAGSVRPVTKGMLKEAIAIDLNSFEDDPPFDIDSIVGICRSLVSTQPTFPDIVGRSWANSPVIRLAHATVKQFLDTPGALDFYLPSPWVQQTLAKACLAHATSPIFEKLQANWESDNSEPGLDYDLWDFLDYCITGFFEHLRTSGAEQDHLPFVLEKFRDPTSLGNYHANAEFVNKCRLQYPANQIYPRYWFNHESEDGETHEYLSLDHKSSILSKAFIYELPSLAWALLVEGIDVHSLDASLWSPVSYFAAAGAVRFLKEVLRDKRGQDHGLKYESEPYPREVLRQILQPLGFGIIVAIGSRNSPSTDFLMNELRRCLGVPGAIGGKTSLQGRLLLLILALSAAVGNESTARSLVRIVEGDSTFTPRDKEEIFQQALYCAAKHGQKACILLLLEYVPTPAVTIPLWQAESLLYARANKLIRSANIRWAELCQEQLSLEVLEDDKLSVDTPDRDDWEGNALLASVSAGKLEVARILVEHGMDPFLDGSAHGSAFSMITSRASSNEGTCNQYWEFLLWLLDDEQPGKPIKPRQDDLDDTLCGCASLDEAAFWLDKGANPDKALISAVKFPRPEILQLLLQKGADPNAKTNDLETPLIALLKDIRGPSSMEILRHLLDHGADPRLTIKTTLRAPKFSHYRGDGGVGSPLLGLARNCSPWRETEDLKRVQGILEKLNAAHILEDINVYISSDNFGTPLIAAASMGGTQTVDFLLEHGARCDVEGHSNVDWSFPALAATLAEYPAIAKMLLGREKYQSLSTKPGSWAKCLILACSQNHDQSEWGDLIEILLEHGVDVNYHMDLTYGRHNKIDPTDKLRQFGCALVAACASGQLGLVQKLLQQGADEYPEHAGNHGGCLAAACASGDESLVDFFIGRGHDVNQLIRGVQYWCPLLATAADGGYDADVVVQRLLQNGANPDITYPTPNPKVSSSDIESLVMGRGESWPSAFFRQRMWEDTMISGPSFDQADFFCGSPFIAAATHHSKDVLELLVENGVDVNKEVPGTYPTAYIATQLIFKKRWKIQNWLLEHGGSQPSPLQILRLNPAALGCIPNSFLHSPPDLALQGSFWGNMLSIFILSLPSTIPYFLKSGADPHAVVPGSFYGSALLATASSARPAAVRTLLESGAQVNATAEETTFGTPLIAACAGRVQFVSQFLTIYDRKEIDDDDDRDEDDWAQNQLDVIKELLFWKADPNLTYGCFSPLLVLVCSGSNRLADCVNLLLDAGAEQDLVLPRYSSAVSSLTRQLLPVPPFCFKVAPLPSLCSQILTLRLVLGQWSRIRA